MRTRGISKRKPKIRWIKGRPFVRVVVSAGGRNETIDLYSVLALRGLVDYLEWAEAQKVIRRANARR